MNQVDNQEPEVLIIKTKVFKNIMNTLGQLPYMQVVDLYEQIKAGVTAYTEPASKEIEQSEDAPNKEA